MALGLPCGACRVHSVAMRVTGGCLRGRRIHVPRRRVRPSQDRVREALFSILAARVDGCRFLDLFAGSGAVGIEAWSRGASEVVWVEQDAGVLTVLRRNVTELCGLDAAPHVVCGRVPALLKRGKVSGAFDLIFADPPYRDGAAPGVVDGILGAVREATLLAAGGTVVIEVPEGGPVPSSAGWQCDRERRYGTTRLLFYERESGAAFLGHADVEND